MSKRTGPIKVNLADYKERKENEGAIDIEAGGETFRIPPPELWPDEIGKLRGDLVAQASLLMGEDRFAAFVAAGGSATLVDAILKDQHGADAGK